MQATDTHWSVKSDLLQEREDGKIVGQNFKNPLKFPKISKFNFFEFRQNMKIIGDY